jgi:hypothetical protein
MTIVGGTGQAAHWSGTIKFKQTGLTGNDTLVFGLQAQGLTPPEDRWWPWPCRASGVRSSFGRRLRLIVRAEVVSCVEQRPLVAPRREQLEADW